MRSRIAVAARDKGSIACSTRRPMIGAGTKWTMPDETQEPLPSPQDAGDPSGRRRVAAARIARRLADLRREHRLSQEAVGQILGASQATVSRWEDPDSPNLPSAVECAELARYYGVTADWLLGLSERRSSLPAGEAVIDQKQLEAFAAARSRAELESLLECDLSFGTIWAEIPEGAELVSVQEAHRRVRRVDKIVRERHPGLWKDWVRLVLG